MDVFGLGIKLQETGAAAVEASLKRLGTELAKTAASVTAITVGFNKLITESVAAQYATAQLEAVIKSTGGVAGQTAEALQDQARALQRVSIYGDDAIVEMQALLLTFTNIRGAVFRDAVPAILNFARTSGDLAGAAQMVGKALEDPVRGIALLGRSLGQFSEEEKKLIQGFVETNRLADAQRVILAKLDQKFAGSAAAARNTLGGAIAGVKNAFGDLFEMSREGSSGLIRSLNGLESAIRGIEAALSYTMPVLVLFATALAVSKWSLIVSTIGMLSNTILALARGINIATIAQWAFNAAQSASPIGLIITAAGAAAAALMAYGTAAQRAAEATDEQVRTSAEYVRALQAIQERVQKQKMEAEAAEQAAEDEKKNRIANLAQLAGLTEITARETRELVNAQAAMVNRLQAGNIALSERIKLILQLEAVEEAIRKQREREQERENQRKRNPQMDIGGVSVGSRSSETRPSLQRTETSTDRFGNTIERTVNDGLKGVGIDALPDPKPLFDRFKKSIEDLETEEIAESIQGKLGASISDGIKGAFSAGIGAAIASGEISSAWKAMAQSIVQSMASAMVDIALAAIKFGTLMENIRNFMVLHPAMAVAAAAAMLAFAYANGGKAMSGKTSVTGGIGGASITPNYGGSAAMPTTQLIFGATSATTAAGMTPRSATNVTIIGPNDPTAQRALQELLTKADTRGRLG